MLNNTLNKSIRNNQKLTTKERIFIASFAIDFIDSYRIGNKVIVDEWDEGEELTEEIDICKKLIEKFGGCEGIEFLQGLEVMKGGRKAGEILQELI